MAEDLPVARGGPGPGGLDLPPPFAAATPAPPPFGGGGGPGFPLALGAPAFGEDPGPTMRPGSPGDDVVGRAGDGPPGDAVALPGTGDAGGLLPGVGWPLGRESREDGKDLAGVTARGGGGPGGFAFCDGGRAGGASVCAGVDA